ncbi:MAG: hypothetical protein AAF628_22910 [Planctomycetota bacterium]
MAVFRFPLQPKLDQFLDDKERIERELADLMERVRAAEQELAAARELRQKAAQRLTTARDHLAEARRRPGRAGELAERHQFAEHLDQLVQQRLAEERAEEAKVVELEHKQKNKGEELLEVHGQVRNLEDFRDRKLKEFEAEQERLAENERDDDAIQRWAHQRREEEEDGRV